MGRRGDARARAREIRHRRLGPAGGAGRARAGWGGTGRDPPTRAPDPTPRGESRERATRVELPEPRARTAAPRSRARRCDEKPRPRAERASAMVVARFLGPAAVSKCRTQLAQVLPVVVCSRWRRETLTPTDAPRARVRAALPPAFARDASRARRPARGHPAPRRRPLARGASRRPRASRGASRAPAPDRAPTGRFASENEPSRLPPPPPPPRRARLRGPSRPRTRPSGTSGASIALPVPASAAGGDRVFPRPRTPEALPGSASDVFSFLDRSPNAPRSPSHPPPPAAALDVPFPSPAPHPLAPPPSPPRRALPRRPTRTSRDVTRGAESSRAFSATARRRRFPRTENTRRAAGRRVYSAVLIYIRTPPPLGGPLVSSKSSGVSRPTPS